jgi:NAD kinase
LKFPLGITLRIIRKMLDWKIRGMHKPSAFFRADGTPVSTPTVRR